MPTEDGRGYLVACVGQKLSEPAPARDLYTSSWFLKARVYVERTGWLSVVYTFRKTQSCTS